MKNQYFGDVNDFQKYALLRLLTEKGKLSSRICWMLTDYVYNNEGKQREHLNPKNQDEWRTCDPELHLFLARENLERDVREVERSGLLPRCTYFYDRVPDDATERKKRFNGFFSDTNGVDLVFFDPDTGLEPPSAEGRKCRYPRYVYFDELKRAYDGGSSLLLYQHFTRQERSAFTKRQAERLQDKLDATCIWSFPTSHVLYLLILHDGAETKFENQLDLATHRWGTPYWPGTAPPKCHRSSSGKP
jgi:hypothetical protein